MGDASGHITDLLTQGYVGVGGHSRPRAHFRFPTWRSKEGAGFLQIYSQNPQTTVETIP